MFEGSRDRRAAERYYISILERGRIKAGRKKEISNRDRGVVRIF